MQPLTVPEAGRPHAGVLILLLLLALAWGLASSRRMTVVPDDGLAGKLLLSERLLLAARFCDPLSSSLKTSLETLARGIEAEPSRMAVIAGRPLLWPAINSLSPGYKLIALYQKTPSDTLRRELKVQASAALTRLNGCLLAISLLLLLALASCMLGRRSEQTPAPTTRPLWLVLGLYWAWDATSLFGVSAIIGRAAAGVSPLTRVLLAAGLSYALMLALLLPAARFTGWRISTARSIGWIGPGYLLCLAGIPLTNWAVERWLGAPLQESPLVVFLLFKASWVQMLLLVGLAGLVGPFFEELMFRDWLLGGLRPHLGSAASIAVSALSFALVHGDPVHLPALLLLGGVLGWTYLRSGSLWASFAVHAMWNASMFCLIGANAP